MRFAAQNVIIATKMARDAIHNAVKNAIIKDGWTITDDPFKIKYGGVTTFADLAAEKVVAAERDGEKIAIEIKSFLGASLITEFEKALGQYRLYRRLLLKVEPERQTYLAVSRTIYDEFFTSEAVKMIVKEEDVSLIIVEIATEKVVKWITWSDIAN